MRKITKDENNITNYNSSTPTSYEGTTAATTAPIVNSLCLYMQVYPTTITSLTFLYQPSEQSRMSTSPVLLLKLHHVTQSTTVQHIGIPLGL
jgi:hypothetical protein